MYARAFHEMRWLEMMTLILRSQRVGRVCHQLPEESAVVIQTIPESERCQDFCFIVAGTFLPKVASAHVKTSVVLLLFPSFFSLITSHSAIRFRAFVHPGVVGL